MAELTNWFANISIKNPTLWMVIASGLAVVLVFLLLGRRQRQPVMVVGTNTNAGGGNSDDTNPVDEWLPPTHRADERRRSLRRTGVPTAVQICDPAKPKRVIDGYVLDRSSGGLRLAMEKPFPTGSALQVRPTNAPPESPWIAIIIRSCREVGDYFEVGVQFQEELPWHLLLMFG